MNPPAFAVLRRDKGGPRSVAAVLALLFVVPVLAQDVSPFQNLDRYKLGYAFPGSQLKDHVYERSRRFFAAGDAERDGIGTVDAVRRRQEDIRQVVIASVGGLPSADTPLNPRVTGTILGDGFRIEKIIFESRPRHYVTANLYLPLNRLSRPDGRGVVPERPSRYGESRAGVSERLPDARAGGTDRACAGSGGAGRAVELFRT